MKRIHDISMCLIKRMMSFYFPYHDILSQQIDLSEITIRECDDLFEIFFNVDSNAPPLPNYLDTMPISWHVYPESGVPYCCQLYINQYGYIQVLEVIDMKFEHIDWNGFWNFPILVDYDYDISHLLNMVNCGPLNVKQIRIVSKAIQFYLESNNFRTSLCFSNCTIRNCEPESLPACLNLEIQKGSDGFRVQSKDGCIDFDCSLAYISYV